MNSNNSSESTDSNNSSESTDSPDSPFEFVTFESTEIYKFTSEGVILLQDRRNFTEEPPWFRKIYLDYSGNIVDEEDLDEDFDLDDRNRDECQRDLDPRPFRPKVIENGENISIIGIPKFTNKEKYADQINFKKLQKAYNETTAFKGWAVTSGCDGNAIVYLVGKQDGEIASVFIDNDYSFQGGDAGTYSYILDGKHLLIWNCGDVWSVVIIRQIE